MHFFSYPRTSSFSPASSACCDPRFDAALEAWLAHLELHRREYSHPYLSIWENTKYPSVTCTSGMTFPALWRQKQYRWEDFILVDGGEWNFQATLHSMCYSFGSTFTGCLNRYWMEWIYCFWDPESLINTVTPSTIKWPFFTTPDNIPGIEGSDRF